MKKSYTQSAEEVLRDLGVGPEGLTTAQAQERLAKYGPNKLKEAEKPTLLQRFLAQLKDPMLIILMIAAAVSALTGMLAGENEWAEVIIILAVVLLNAILGVIQESKAEAAIEALQTMTAATCKVLRDGKMVVLHSDELVPGDVVLLEAGDAVPADGRIIENASMKIEEAALTGESVPVNKMLEALYLGKGQDDVPLGDRKNMCYMGSTVVYGRGKAVITTTGMDTEMGKIAGALAATEEEETPCSASWTSWAPFCPRWFWASACLSSASTCSWQVISIWRLFWRPSWWPFLWLLPQFLRVWQPSLPLFFPSALPRCPSAMRLSAV